MYFPWRNYSRKNSVWLTGVFFFFFYIASQFLPHFPLGIDFFFLFLFWLFFSTYLYCFFFLICETLCFEIGCWKKMFLCLFFLRTLESFLSKSLFRCESYCDEFDESDWNSSSKLRYIGKRRGLKLKEKAFLLDWLEFEKWVISFWPSLSRCPLKGI